MAAPRKLPPVEELARLVDAGWTHQQIADHVYATTGQKVTRASVSSALSRAGRTTDKPRYTETIPWRVRQPHLTEYPARMLRLLGRRRNGDELTANETQRLEHWLRALAEANAVVGYDPDNLEQGFHYVDPDGSDGKDGIPIHRQRIWTLPQ